MKFADFISSSLNNRPSPKRNLDQFYAKLSTVERRVDFLKGLPGFEKKEILFLGDDDLTSLATAFYFPEKRIVVVDIDEEILEFIKKISKGQGWRIEVFRHDLRNPLPKDKFKDFQLIFFDPPYTPLAFQTWLQRALEASMGSGRNFKRKSIDRLEKIDIVCCYGYTSREPERFLKIQEIITKMGVVIHQKLRDFNEYEGAKSLGGRSDLLHLKPTPKVNLKVLDGIRSRFYTGRRKGEKA